MDPITWIAAITVLTMVTSGTRDISSILKGKEAPTLEKYRMRHEKGHNLGDAMTRLKAPKKSGKAAGPLTIWRRAVVENAANYAAEKSKNRGDRRVQWYRDHGRHVEDEAWHAKQQNKIRRQQEKVHNFKVKKGLAEPEPEPQQQPEPEPDPEQNQPEQQQPEQQSEESAKADQDQENEEPAKPDLKPVADLDEHRSRKDDAQDSDNQNTDSDTEPTNTADKAATNTGGNMYAREADDLVRRADDIASYRRDLAEFADGLSPNWGNEVVGPVQEMDEPLLTAENELLVVANLVKQQGDAAAEAYEQAPFAPDRDVLV